MIKLNEETHEYTRSGLKVPGVTRVLQAAGIIDLSKIPAEKLERARKFGSACHKATELHDKGVLDVTTLDEALNPYMEAWFSFLDTTGFVVEIDSIEQKVYSEKYHYAGKYDRIGTLNGKRTVIDIATSVDFSIAKALQTAAYLEAENESKPAMGKVKQREIVLLKGDGTFELTPEGFFDKSDFRVFLAALTLYTWKKNHGK